jgi:hypothetical protein
LGLPGQHKATGETSPTPIHIPLVGILFLPGHLKEHLVQEISHPSGIKSAKEPLRNTEREDLVGRSLSTVYVARVTKPILSLTSLIHLSILKAVELQ